MPISLKNIKFIISGLLLILSLFIIWLIGLFNFVDNISISKPYNFDDKTDAIVILTGGSDRVTSGISLLEEGKADKMFISGVGTGADLFNMLILSGSLPDNIANLIDNIEIGYEAKDTKGNALETAKWVEKNNFKSLRLVTANYHTPRSLLEFKTEMPNINIQPHPISSPNVKLDNWTENSGTRSLLIKEYNKFLASKF